MSDASPAPVNFLAYVPFADWSGIIAGTSAYDIASAVAQANATGVAVSLPPGQYFVGTTCVFNVAVQLQSGASFNVSSGVTLTFGARFEADPSVQCFVNATAGLGRIAFNLDANSEGHPEWWGAIGNNTGAQSPDCLPGIQACIAALPLTRLQACTYYLSGPIVMSASNKILQGVNKNWEANNLPMTRLCLMAGAPSQNANVIFVGSVSQPSSIALFVNQVIVRDLMVARTGGPYAPATGYGGPSGIWAQYATNCLFERVFASEHCNGFYTYGCVFTKYRDCTATRSTASPVNAANDYYVSFNNDQSAPLESDGTASGNASIYYEGCNAVGASSVKASYMFFLPSGYTDTYIRDCEGSTFTQFVLASSDASNQYSGQDFQISRCVFDAYTLNGISITSNTGVPAGNVTLVDNYLASTGNAVGAGIALNGLRGGVTVMSNKILGDSGTTTGTGIVYLNCHGVVSAGNLVSNAYVPINVSSSSSVDVQDNVNYSSSATPQTAVQLTSVTRSYLRCVVHGAATKFPWAVSADSACQYNEINLSAIDPAAVSGGSSHKLQYNGAAWGGGSTFGTGNLATGVLN